MDEHWFQPGPMNGDEGKASDSYGLFIPLLMRAIEHIPLPDNPKAREALAVRLAGIGDRIMSGFYGGKSDAIECIWLVSTIRSAIPHGWRFGECCDHDERWGFYEVGDCPHLGTRPKSTAVIKHHTETSVAFPRAVYESIIRELCYGVRPQLITEYTGGGKVIIATYRIDELDIARDLMAELKVDTDVDDETWDDVKLEVGLETVTVRLLRDC